MKAIIVSDTHKKGEVIEDIVKFAKEQKINTIFDAGDLHGSIESYSGIENLHAVYWEKACDAMESWKFENAVMGLGGTVHQNGTAFCIDDLAVFMQHDLAEYESDIPKIALEKAESELDFISEDNPEMKRLILFGHTHNMFNLNTGKSIAINPGHAGLEKSDATFAVIDTDTGVAEYRFVKNPGEILMTVGGDSEFAGFRSFFKGKDGKSFIGTLKNGKEVGIHGDKRTAEYDKIIFSHMKEGLSVVKCQNPSGTQQFVINGTSRKEYAHIGKIFEYFNKEGEAPKQHKGFIAGVEIDGVVKEILVSGENDAESHAFDAITDDISPIIEDGLVCFVGRTHIDGKTDKYKPHIAHLVVNNKIVADYSSVSRMEKVKDLDTILVRASTDDKKQLIATVDKDGTLKEGKKHDNAAYADIIDGKLVYAARDGEEKFVVVDGVEQKKHKANSDAYEDKISDISFVDGELTYIVHDKAGKKYGTPTVQTLVYAGEEVASVECKGYNSGINRVQEVDGKLAYIIQPDEGNAKIVIDGEVVLEKSVIKDFEFIDGRLAYDNGNYSTGYIWEDGSKVDSEVMKVHMEAKIK